MSLKTRPLVSSSLKASYLAVTLALAFPAVTHAAVLGDIHVISSFGQPFKAEIPLNNVTKREDGKLVPGLGKPEDYQKSKADFNAAYASLKFDVIKRGEQQFIEVTSAEPLNISLYDLVVELRGGIQRQVREYSFLMDSSSASENNAETKTTVEPPVVSAPAPISSPVSSSADASENANQDQHLAEQVVKTPADAEVKGPALSSTPQSVSGKISEKKMTPAQLQKAASDLSHQKGQINNKSFVVSKGDILGSIAKQMKSRQVSLNQMMIALLRANPDAFVDNNINRLKSGVILKVPTASAASTINAQEADQLVIAQINDFDRYRQTLANHTARSRAERTGSSQRGSGKISVHVRDEKNRTQPEDRLKLSKAGKSTAKAEDRIASEKALDDANSRVKALEKNVADLQKLLAMKNQALAEAQSNANEQAADKKAEQSQGKGMFAEMKEGLSNAWKRLMNFFGSLNDIPHFAQITVGFLIGLMVLFIGLILNRIRKNKEKHPEEVKDDAALAAVAAGTAAAAAAYSEQEESEPDEEAADANAAPVDIGKKIDFDLNLDNAAAEKAESEPVLNTTVDQAQEPTTPEVMESAPAETIPEPVTSVTPEPEPAAEAPAAPVSEPVVQSAPAAEPVAEAPVAAEPAPEPVPAPAPAESVQPTAVPAADSAGQAPDEPLDLDIPSQVDENGLPTPEQAKKDELTMKLDLASAYQEIGDNEGAKELLEEIINSGDAEFAAQAKQKLASLQA